VPACPPLPALASAAATREFLASDALHPGAALATLEQIPAIAATHNNRFAMLVRPLRGGERTRASETS
jgi:hypothetical protein